MIELDLEIEVHGRTLNVTVEADGRVYRDLYGADADGRRGEWRTELDDFEMTVKDGHGKDITAKLKAKHQSVYADLEEEAENALFEQFNEGPEYEPE